MEFSKILCIDFKRIDATNKKRHTLVDFPLTDLSLEKYVIGYNSKKFVYDLYGVCNHHGTTAGGHYTAYIKGMIVGMSLTIQGLLFYKTRNRSYHQKHIVYFIEKNPLYNI